MAQSEVAKSRKNIAMSSVAEWLDRVQDLAEEIKAFDSLMNTEAPVDDPKREKPYEVHTRIHPDPLDPGQPGSGRLELCDRFEPNDSQILFDDRGHIDRPSQFSADIAKGPESFERRCREARKAQACRNTTLVQAFTSLEAFPLRQCQEVRPPWAIKLHFSNALHL